MTEITKVSSTEPTIAESARAIEAARAYLQATGLSLSQKQTDMFLNVCSAFGLNPIKKEVYAVGYGDKFNIITGYETYIKRANRSGLLKGWKAWVEGESPNLVAKVEIYRKDWTEPFTHEVYQEEYDTKQSIWKTKPKTMLKKVAIGQGFRLCFPEDLGGMPYLAEEVTGEAEIDITPKDIPVTPAIEAITDEEELTALAEKYSDVWQKEGWTERISNVMDEGPDHIHKALEACKTKLKAMNILK